MNVRLYRFFFENRSVGLKTTTELIHDVDGWKNYGVTFGRETGISNIVKSYTNSWIFVGEDANYLKSIFYRYGANSKVRLIIKKLSNYLTQSYEIDYAGYFDFTQIVISNTVTMPISEGGFFKLLENKWSKDYEVEMNNVVLGFDGIKIPDDCFFVNKPQISAPSPGSEYAERTFLVGLKPINTEKDYNLFQESISAMVTGTPNAYTLDNAFFIIKSGELNNFKISYDFKMGIKLTNVNTSIGYHWKYKLYCDVIEFNYTQFALGGLNQTSIISSYPIVSPTSNEWMFPQNDINAQNYEFILNKKGTINVEYPVNSTGNGKVFMLRFKLLVDTEQSLLMPNATSTVIIYNMNFYCSNYYKINKNRKFQCVKIDYVFQELIKSINNNKHVVEIDLTELNKYVANDEINRYDVLTDGNGLRGFALVLNAQQLSVLQSVGVNLENQGHSWTKLTTSLEKLLKFLYIIYGLKIVLNYDIVTDKYKVSMLHEDSSFNNTQIAQIDNIKNYKIVPERELFYTDIKVGYTNKDDSVGGKEEYNGTLEFSTMITEIEQNVLDLVSPYSASVFDIETFLYNNYQNFSDGADKDSEIFVLSCKKHATAGSGYFSIRRGVPMTSGIAFPQSAWNLELTPKRILLNHKKLLNSCFAFNLNERITLSAVKRNRTVNAGGIVELDPIIVDNDKSFYPIIIEFEAPATENLIKSIEKNRNGYISFMHNNIKYKGYLYKNSSVTINPMNEKSSTFTLICHAEGIPQF